VAKRRTKKITTKGRSLKEVLILLGILFSAILFIIKVITGGIGWLEVFAPVLITFFIVFLLSVLKTALRKV
jgi:glucan phosphoethanolaminetransferase (alkaline phosphatase superfamily)